jgi:rhodanese-related sulfurtransferase
MTGSEILLYAIAALVLFFIIRRRVFQMQMKQYSPSEVSAKVDDPSVIILDVRTHEERQRYRRIEQSMHIPLQNLSSCIHSLDRHRQKEIICYCRTGSRSLTAARILQKQGFNAANMKGGIVAWNSLGLK